MSQRFNFGPNTAISTIEKASINGHDGKLEKGFFSASVSWCFAFSTKGRADVFYVNTPRYRILRGNEIVESGGLQIHAIDSLARVSNWTFVSVDDDDLIPELAQKFARSISGRYEKAVVIDVFPDRRAEGLLSVYFPMLKEGVYSESVPYADTESFNLALSGVLGNVRQKCVG